jgi:hypothetical protein
MFAAGKKDIVNSGDNKEPDKKDRGLGYRHQNAESQEFDEGDGYTPLFCVLNDDDVACSTQYRQVSGNRASRCKCKKPSICCTRLKEHWDEQVLGISYRAYYAPCCKCACMVMNSCLSFQISESII